MLGSEIRKFGKEKGANLVGFADVSKFPADGSVVDPRFYLPNAKTVVVFGLKLVDAIWDKLSGTYDVHAIHLVNYLRHYNYDLLDFIAIQTARFIEELGYDVYPIEARTETKVREVLVGFFPFKEAARLSGLGMYGKSSMIITPEYGPRNRWVALITDLEIEEDEPRKESVPQSVDEVCGSCTLCIDRCPVKAISYENGTPLVNQRLCQAYMNVANNCALCQGICIKGKQAAMKRRQRKNDRMVSRAV